MNLFHPVSESTLRNSESIATRVRSVRVSESFVAHSHNVLENTECPIVDAGLGFFQPTLALFGYTLTQA
jgi:hypothetical protein